MNKKLIGVICVGVLLMVCVALTSYFWTTNWGKAVYGVQLSIDSTNNVAEVGSIIMLTERISNQSTNDILLAHVANSYVLSSHIGNTYKLIPPINRGSHEPPLYVVSEIPRFILAGETKLWSIRLKIQDGIEPGDYRLEDVRSIIIESNRVYSITSNQLKVKAAK